MSTVIFGSSGFLGNKISKLLKKEKKIEISTKNKKNIYKTNIFKKRYKHEKWISKIGKKDTLIILSSPGSIKFYSKNKKKILLFENYLENRLFKKVNNKVRVIFLSSDMVFQGGKNIFLDNSKRLPKNSYGRSKRKIENKLSKYFSKLIILRLPKIYSENLKDDTFYSQIIRASRKKKITKLFVNQKMHYMNLKDFLVIIKKVIRKRSLKGSFNLPSKYLKSRYKISCEFIKRKDLNLNYLKPLNYKNVRLNLPNQVKMKTNLYKKINFYPKY
tara:strand:- start:1066 stop:1884 length:819 start_codon:yes stop_codon:yes gene_type:complete